MKRFWFYVLCNQSPTPMYVDIAQCRHLHTPHLHWSMDLGMLLCHHGAAAVPLARAPASTHKTNKIEMKTK